ncbi:xanthine dehydrogenase family protein molybdopterin-binding subunit [Acidaminobacter sp. JC074]|uniref:xanthine dehydrogenase family protein molybdopterin-binding subunit n=1 Tax=Acidaminobacter sp. JC074 TaxID=2530199 RepID=UPI001F0FB8EA|nr:xanthine dehydrogenase family protein molybdopterin-binding subunit [Acidaminobacter sp. JC074]MCH4890099.1 xanthine dehydrogenase family protein molybdopterin-binding subunit [Acidaminobacter sp. JC074]
MKGKVGSSVRRKESYDKVHGNISYTADEITKQMLHAAIKTSPHAYARILKVDKDSALKSPGVRAILTGEDVPNNIGLYLSDKPPIARDYVRHYGEVVAAVVADTYEHACKAAALIEVTYERLRPVMKPLDALKEGADIIHKDMATYSHIDPIHPEPGTNISNRTKVRKGDVKKAFSDAKEVVESFVEIEIGDHVAMETRASICEIRRTGDVYITSTTQAPFVVKGLMSAFYDLDPGKIVVKAPLLGGGFGGKAGIQLEGLAYLLSKAVGGQKVRFVNSREEDLVTSPGNIGLQAKVKLSVDENNRFTGMDLDYYFNSGAYADYAVNVSRAAAISCTGPYHVENVRCDSMCVYTNLPFATAYRGFGHIEMGFAIERAIDKMAKKLAMDPYELRRINGIRPGDLTPVGSKLNKSTGDIITCFDEVNDMLGGQIDKCIKIDDRKVLVKGIAGLWKAPAMPTNTDAGAVITFNSDGSVNVHTGIVEIGQGTKTGLAQIASESLDIPLEKIHVEEGVNTRTSPCDWATAASRGLFMAGNALLEACEDAKKQLKDLAASILRVPAVDLVVQGERVYVPDEPEIGLSISELSLGYVYPNGNAVYGQIIGRGKYIAKHLTDIDKESGQGHPDLEWTLGAEGVEIEVDMITGQYKILKAVCCIDVGKVINPEIAKGQIIGGMAMGIGYTTMEGFKYNTHGQITSECLRDFKIMRYSDAPIYEVKFLETPQFDGPFGARGLGEQSVIGMPGAISNALSRAVGKDLSAIPITPEKVWEKIQEASDD